MVQTNKVLTVSYGTFSCTLEGFEDSFGTMKAIAEYFRDLAADDRYFGAEPPQPDADMLARIAQREISRRVEAHSDGSGIVLRAGKATAALDAVTSTDAAPGSDTAAADASGPETLAEPPARPEASAEPVHAPAAEAPAMQTRADGTAAAEAATEVTAPEVTAPAMTAPETATDEASGADTIRMHEDLPGAADTAPGAQPLAAAATDFAAGEELEAVDAPEEVAGEDVSASAPAVEDQPEPTPETVSETPPAPDSIAAKLQRIREVVARTGATMTDDTELEAEEDNSLLAAVSQATAEPSAEAVTDRQDAETQAVREDTLSLAAEEIEAALDEDAATLDEDMMPDGDGLEEIPAALSDHDESDAEMDSEEAVSDAIADSSEAGADVSADVRESGEDEELERAPEAEPFNLAAFETVTSAARLEEYDEEYDDAPEDDIGSGEDTIFAGLDEDGNDEVEEDEVRNILADETSDAQPRSRVVKVRRSDLEQAIESGVIEAVDEDEPEDRAPSALSDEEEADLMRELAQVEAEFGGQPASEPEQDMQRLMAEAGEKMQDEESSANRETFAQLRAAVAATKAEEEVTGKPPLLTLDKEYRDDLARVVRPTRPLTQSVSELRSDMSETPAVDDAPQTTGAEMPATPAEPTQAPATTRPTRPRTRPATRRPTADLVAPLKLVAEQRVDQSDAPRAPVRPRRVTTALLDADGQPGQNEESVGGFAAFAEKSGASGLLELLEAAAAYMSYVEGRDQFSRPQLMTKVRQVEKDDFNREDGLRSFGQLLREGKIEKAGGGRFTASPDIGFRPDQRAAG